MNCQLAVYSLSHTPQTLFTHHPHSIPNLFPHSRSIILSHKIPFYYHTAKAGMKRLVNFFLCASKRSENFVISSEMLNSRRCIHVSSSSYPACLCYPIRFLFLSFGAWCAYSFSFYCIFSFGWEWWLGTERSEWQRRNRNRAWFALLSVPRSPSRCDGKSNCAWRFYGMPIYHFPVSIVFSAIYKRAEKGKIRWFDVQSSDSNRRT